MIRVKPERYLVPNVLTQVFNVICANAQNNLKLKVKLPIGIKI